MQPGTCSAAAVSVVVTVTGRSFTLLSEQQSVSQSGGLTRTWRRKSRADGDVGDIYDSDSGEDAELHPNVCSSVGSRALRRGGGGGGGMRLCGAGLVVHRCTSVTRNSARLAGFI